MELEGREGSSDGSSSPHTGANGIPMESKLDLFGFDSLVNILGLESMTGEQIQAPSSLEEMVRMIVGMAGIWESLLLVAFCGACTFLTSISLSAIRTNGAMKGWGPYYLIGHALGPEVGVSIGLCFFLGTAVAGALFVLGAVETFLDAVPGAGIFSA
ncbi:Cation-chloride cotransporter 1-like protein [Drosera capensis]